MPLPKSQHITHHILNGVVLVIFAVIALGLSLEPHSSITSKPTETHKTAAKSTAAQAPTPEAAPPQAAPVAAPPKSTPKVVAQVPVPNGAPAEPVVTPSPSSNVSSLTPVAPESPASDSSSGSSTSSSGSGSSTSTSTPPAGTTTTSYTSTNWSGYFASIASYSGVSAAWAAPTATGTGSAFSADATWIGIGGVTSDDLIQVGTENSFSANGQETTDAFYELLPAASVTIPNITVSPGDSISANLAETSAGQWYISITDKTDNQSFTTTVTYSSSLSSAEWIEEDPSFANGRLVPFDNFGSVAFTASSTIAGGSATSLTSAKAQPIIMVNHSGQPIAIPSSLGSDGASFSVTHS